MCFSHLRSSAACSILAVVLILFSFLLKGCDSGSGGEEEPVEMYDLIVIHGEGISGMPESGVYQYQEGEEIAYNFSTTEGYRNLTVSLDAANVDGRGNITIRGRHFLFVGAERIQRLPAGGTQAQIAIKDLLNQPDKIQGFEALLDEVRSFSRTASQETRAENLRAIFGTTIDRSDPAQLQSVQTLEFVLSGRGYVLNAMDSQGKAESQVAGQVDVVYINGIWTSFEDMTLAVAELEQLIAEGPIEGARIGFYYNKSGLNADSQTQCLLNLLPSLLITGKSGWLPLQLTCEVLGRAEDALEALGQIANLESSLALIPADEAAQFSRWLKEEFIDQGRKVIIVAHSQGNLMLQEALFGSTTVLAPEDRSNIGFVSMAAPRLEFTPDVSSFDYILVENEIMDIATDWDIIPIRNLAVPLSTTLSREVQPDIESYTSTCSTIDEDNIGSCLLLASIVLGNAIKLHGVGNSYFGAPESRQWIKEKLLAQVDVFQESGSPDLVVNSLSFTPVNPTDKDNVFAQFTLTNNGDQASGAFLYRLLYNGNEVIKSTVASLNPGQSVNLTSDLKTNPVGTVPVTVEVDPDNSISESNETNNSRVENLVVNASAEGPDLVVSSFTFSPPNPTDEDNVLAQFTLANNGDQASGAFSYRLLYDGIEVSKPTVVSLNPGQRVDLTYDLKTNPVGTVPVTVEVDPDNAINESNEINNSRTENLLVTSSVEGADLVINSLSFTPTNPTDEDNVLAQFTLANNGDQASGVFSYRLLYNGIEVTRPAVASLNPGESVSLTYDLKTNPVGTVPVTVEIDPANAINESDETNNSLTKDLIVIASAEGPDLVVNSLSFTPANPTNEEDVLAQFTLTNNGDQTSGVFSYRLLYNGIEVTRPAVASLNPGESVSLSYDLKTNPVGTVPIAIEVDPDNAISESDETNNSLTEDLVVIASADGPDLVVNSLSFTPANPTDEDDVLAQFTLTNNGDQASGAFLYRLLYNGVEVTRPAVASLNPGESVSLSYDLKTNPVGTVPIAIEVDPDNAISESDEANNTLTENLIVIASTEGPDLVVSSLIHAPETPTTTDLVTFTATVTNQGDEIAVESVLQLMVGGESTPVTYFIPELSPAASFSVVRQVSDMVAQNYQNTATADINNSVVETDESNNVTLDFFTVVEATLGPDLVVSSFTHTPANPTTTDLVTLSATVTNQGDEVASTSSLELKVGGESTPPSYTIPELSPGESFSMDRQVSDLNAQSYQNTATADINNNVVESVESNNVTLDFFTVDEGSGSISVTNSTTGQDIPTDPYTAILDVADNDPPVLSIPVNGAVTFNEVSAGAHTVTLGGIDSNCTVSGGITQDVTVTVGNTTTASFTITCESTATGSIQVTNATTGQNLPTSPYIAILDVADDNPPSLAIPVNGSVIFSDVSTGSHTITLGGVDSNCTTSGGITKTVSVSSGNTSIASFSITCE